MLTAESGSDTFLLAISPSDWLQARSLPALAVSRLAGSVSTCLQGSLLRPQLESVHPSTPMLISQNASQMFGNRGREHRKDLQWCILDSS